MSAFSEKDFDAGGYSKSRPSYPESFYKLLDNYHRGSRYRLIDVGCGPGTATFQLADNLNSFQEIIGTDISATMVERARKRKTEHPGKYANVSFAVSPADDFTFLAGSESTTQRCDIITAVQCAHWLDFFKFQNAVANVLRKDGTLAVWGYADPIFPEYPKLDNLLDEFTYGAKYLGPFWDPGRQVLRNLLRELHVDTKLFTDVEERCFDGIFIRSKKQNPLLVTKTFTLKNFENYIKSWSSYHSWRKSNQDEEGDITKRFSDRVLQLYPQMTPQSRLQVVWKSFYKLGRRL